MVCDFIAYPKELVTVVDGYSARPKRMYRVEGWTHKGQRLPDVEVSV